MKTRNKISLVAIILGLIVLASFIWTPSLLADIQIDAVNSGSTTSGGSSITIPLDVSGTNRLMLVGVSLNPNWDEWVDSVTWKGTEDLTLDGRVIVNDNDARVEIWKLVAPTTGSGNVVVTFSAPLQLEAVAGAMTFTGVDQSTPLGNFASVIGNDSTPATVDVDSAADELVFGVVACEYSTVTTDLSQDERWNISVSNTNGAGSTETSAGATVTTSWAVDSPSGTHWAVGGVSIKPSVGTALDVWVTASDDDAEEGSSMDITSSDLELPNEGTGNPQWVGIRFQGITVPQGSSIQNAYIQFATDETNNTSDTDIEIFGEATDDADAFADSSGYRVTDRALTSTSVDWLNVPEWTIEHEQGVDQRTPDLSSIIEEIVGRPGWQSGYDLVIILVDLQRDNIGERCAESWNGANGHGDLTLAPMLHLEHHPTLIELSSFTATPLDSAVLLEWETATELDNEGFNLLRSEQEYGQYVKINRNFIPSKGEAGFGAEYSYTDYDVENGVTYYYLLEAIDFNGKSTLHGPVSATPNDIVLIWPIEWEPVPAGSSLFMWSSSGNFSFKVEVSASASFPASGTITFPKEGWSSDLSFWLRPEEWELILRKAQASGGYLFWRVRAKGKGEEEVFSDWRKFSIERPMLPEE